MALYKRTNGKIVTVNDTPGSFDYVESLGWVREDKVSARKVLQPAKAGSIPRSEVVSAVKKVVNKRKRRTKAEMAEDK